MVIGFSFVKKLFKALLDERGSVIQWILIIIICALLTVAFFGAVKPGASDFSMELGEAFNRIVK
jgi:hypothetical protein